MSASTSLRVLDIGSSLGVCSARQGECRGPPSPGASHRRHRAITRVHGPSGPKYAGDAMLTVRLFGGVEADVDGEPVEAPARRRAWHLLAWLALHPGLHQRGELAARFWPDVLDQSARASLRSALWALRRALGPVGASCLVTTGDRVGMAPGAPVWVDALDFDAHVAD